MSNFARTDLSALQPCDVITVHRLPAIGSPGDQITCSCGADLVVDAAGRWTRYL
ncbi:MAG: hypothetical protein ACRDRJ_03075 [Streptosporangiaceae bacterium]